MKEGIVLRAVVFCISLLFATQVALAEEPSVDSEEGEKLVSGMSIVGNDEAPKSLVIVPWKSSDMGETLDVSRVMDDGRDPVDRDVFARELDYYEIRTGSPESP